MDKLNRNCFNDIYNNISLMIFLILMNGTALNGPIKMPKYHS